jgi:hypothetical protein
MNLRHDVAALADKTSDSYSFDRLSSWTELTRLLLKGFDDERKVEAILRSKYIRWACDAQGKYDGISAKAVVRWLDANLSDKIVKELVAGTFYA